MNALSHRNLRIAWGALRDYGVGSYVLWRERHRFRAAVDELNPIAIFLEFDVFPDLRDDRVDQLDIECNGPGGVLNFRCAGQRGDLAPQRAPALVKALLRVGIQHIELDTSLESGQIGEAILIALRAGPELAGSVPGRTIYIGWEPARLASALVGLHGYKKFCAVLRVNRSERRLTVKYAYCPLLLSRLLQRYSRSAGQFSDHRAFFRLAPRAALLTFLLFVLPAGLESLSPWWRIGATVTTGGIAALALWTGLHAIGSIQYDKEHYETVRKAYLDQTRHLARFPEVNPDPILELDLDGNIIFTNATANNILARSGVPPSECGLLLPPDRPGIIRSALNMQNGTHSFEHSVGNRTYRYTTSAFPDDSAVIVSGKDITELREAERALRALNRNLEERIRDRTLELALTQDVTIMCLAGLAEIRDPETGLHLDRTRHYVRALAEKLRSHPRFENVLTEESIHRAYKSAPLHDIGKVGICDAVLLKPGRLSAAEFEEIKTHPVLGGDALQIAENRLGFNSFLTMAKEIAYFHHERWDGNGYPHGLSGDDIPWAARLMAIADVYDALTSRRPYKEPWSHEEARDEIVKNSGTQFDPDVVAAFIAIEAEFIYLSKKFAEPEVVTSASSRDL